MSVGIEGLFTSALGLVPPWEVDKVELDTARRRIDFELRCSAKALACPHCGAADQRIHDRLRRSWRHLDFFQFEAWLHKGQSYITVVHDLDAKRLLFAVEGRDHQTVVDFAAYLKAHDGNPEAVLDRTVRSIVETRGECRQHPDSCIAQVFTCQIPRQM